MSKPKSSFRQSLTNTFKSRKSFSKIPPHAYVSPGLMPSDVEDLCSEDSYIDLPAHHSSETSHVLSSTPKQRSVHFQEDGAFQGRNEVVHGTMNNLLAKYRESSAPPSPAPRDKYRFLDPEQDVSGGIQGIANRLSESVSRIRSEMNAGSMDGGHSSVCSDTPVKSRADVRDNLPFIPTAPYVPDFVNQKDGGNRGSFNLDNSGNSTGIRQQNNTSLPPAYPGAFSGSALDPLLQVNPWIQSFGSAPFGGDVLQNAFLRAQRPRLPEFDPENCISWFSVMKKRFADYGITDPYRKYQLMTGVFTGAQLRTLDPYLSKGTKEQHYDNLIEGITKLYAPNKEERIRLAMNMTMDKQELPSTLANNLKTLHGFDDDMLRAMVSAKLPCDVRRQLSVYDEVSYPKYLELADKIFISDRANNKTTKVEDFKKDGPEISKTELAMLQILASMQDTLIAQKNQMTELTEGHKK